MISQEKLPLLIAARNEERFIGHTLSRLDPHLVEPIIVVNDSSDDTFEIASRSGCDVLMTDQPGKMNALKMGLRHMGNGAKRDVLFTDADTYPLFPRQWPDHMRRALLGKSAATGMYLSGHEVDRDPLSTVMGALRVANMLHKKIRDVPHTMGGNLIIDFSDEDALERVLSLEDYGLNDDLAIVDAATKKDLTRQRITFDPRAAVVTSSRYMPSLKSMLRGGKASALERVEESRAERFGRDAPPYHRDDS